MNKKIVAVGGGSGLSTLLRGLKKYPFDITAVVAVSDDGGSSGKLRNELGVLPPGDIRNCLVSLSEEESIMAKLFQYRFPKKGSLSNHSFGNLFITALSEVSGGFDKAIANAGDVLAIKGRVLPVSLENVTLKASLSDGKIITGESNISKIKSAIDKVEIFPHYAKVSKDVKEAFLNADYVILGPGSLYTSVIVNLLFDGVTAALKKTKAKKIYICNIMTQAGETQNFSLSDHIAAIEKHSYKGILDCVLVNNGKISVSVAQRYARESSIPVKVDTNKYKNVKIIRRDFISRTQYAHHDFEKLAKTIFSVITGDKRK